MQNHVSDGKKVFGIGFHKTGTQSLDAALKILGYKAVHGDPRKAPHGGTEGRVLLEEYIKKGSYRLPTFELYDAFTDNPYFSIWKELVNLFPDARYILTIRDEDKWIRSCLSYYSGRRVRPMREWMFGDYADPSKDKESKRAWLAAYRRHNAGIIEYFQTKNKELLIMDISQGDGWSHLCPFLIKPMPSAPFPHINKSGNSRYGIIKAMLPISAVNKLRTWLK